MHWFCAEVMAFAVVLYPPPLYFQEAGLAKTVLPGAASKVWYVWATVTAALHASVSKVRQAMEAES